MHFPISPVPIHCPSGAAACTVFSQDIDWSVLIGNTIESVCFAAFQIDLHLEPGRIITIHGTWRLNDGADESSGSGQSVRSCSSLISLVEDHIVSAQRIDDRRLAIGFRSGKVLELIDDQEAYECFEFRGPDRHIVV